MSLTGVSIAVQVLPTIITNLNKFSMLQIVVWAALMAGSVWMESVFALWAILDLPVHKVRLHLCILVRL